MKLFFLLLLASILSCSRNNSGIPKQYVDDPSVDRILMVHHTEGSKARARFYTRDGHKWTMALECSATVGQNGIGKTREGDGKTPTGDFEVTGAFGIDPNPGTSLPYTDITPSTFACDEDCPYYNMIIDTSVVHHDCKGESMYNIDPQYRYGLTIDYNSDRVYPRGSAIFIHCTGKKPYTAGCISFSKSNLLKIIKESHPGMRIIID